MKVYRYLYVLAGVAFVVTLLAAYGCGGQKDDSAELERLHEVYIETEYKVSRLAGFFDALEEFDLENALFYEEATEAIEQARTDADEIRDNLEELRGFGYGGQMEQLGVDISEYCDRVDEALAELDEMYQPLLDILQALEPTLREEAEITQMDVPATDAEFTERIVRITEALEQTLAGLELVRVPESLANYKLLQVKMFGALQQASNGLLALAKGQDVEVDLNDNPSFDRYQELSGLHNPLLLDIKEALKIYNLDASSQKVEDDFYDLYLQKSSEDEDKR